MAGETGRVRNLFSTLVGVLRLAREASLSGLVTTVTAAVVQAVIPPVIVLLGKNVVDLVVRGSEGGSTTFGDVVPTIIALGVAAAALRAATTIARHRQVSYASAVELHAERRLIERVATLDLGYFDRPDWYDRAARATRDLSWRPYSLASTLVSLAGSAVGLLAMLLLLSSLSPILALLGLVAVAPTALIQRRLNEDLYRFWTDTTADERQRQYLRDLLSQPASSKEVRAFGLAGPLLERHAEVCRRRLTAMGLLHARGDRLVVVTAVISGAAFAAAFALVASRGLAGELTPGDLAIVIGAFTGVTTQMSSALHSVFELDQNATFLQDYFACLEIEPLVPVAEHPVPLPARLDDGVRLDGVTFTHPNQVEPTLRDVTLHVSPGQVLALVGPNGAGKTTLVKLLLRFHDPQNGSVTVGGVDVRLVDPAQLRERFGVLFQDFARFELTVRDNVALGRVDRVASDEAVLGALRDADAGGVLSDLEGGLDSNVGRLFEGGHDLSGGEWQRLAVARLLYRDADIWVMDEPTSALDAEAEAALFARLHERLRGRIGIVISHRFSTVRAADVIAVMDAGRITEIGTHDELVAAGGTYANLFALQAAGYR